MGVLDDNISYFWLKPYLVTSHLNRHIETVQMRGHNICFYAELTKIIPNYRKILPLIALKTGNMSKLYALIKECTLKY